MKSLRRVAFIGNYLPRRCGIATFTHDLHMAVAKVHPELEISVVAMTDPGSTYDFPQAVRFQIRDDIIADNVHAAEFLNRAGIDVVSLQHEYGIFGGDAGGNIIELVSRLEMPIVTTLHTVLGQPTPTQRKVMDRVIEASTKIIVMAQKGSELLRAVHGVPAQKIDVIPHGIPDVPFLDTHHAKEKLGFAGKEVILTFGLLSPSKGIETMLDAMPGIINSCPNAVYVILGATHPNLVRDHGEAYRQGLMARVHELGIEDHVVFFNQFVEQSTLLEFISMCDVYVTPYLNQAQMTSGTLAYSFGLGRAVVSTPYWHAKELLGDGRGILVPFGDAKAMSAEIAGLLINDVRRHAMRKRAYAASRSMTWTETGKRYLANFEAACEHVRPAIAFPGHRIVSKNSAGAIPDVKIGHFLSLCDSTGMLQHAAHTVADRAHGYCVDDNARALMLTSALSSVGDAQLSERLTARFAAFVQHAWNADTRRFRNFMSFDRRWLEDQGSEDSHGRTLWALGECTSKDTDASRKKWAASLFRSALPVVEEFSSPRAWAFSLLGLDAYCAVIGADFPADRMRRLLADRLMALLATSEPENWPWFESVLAYDNARLPQALIQTGMTTRKSSYVAAGLRSLRWLMALQTAPSGCFRPVGTKSFGQLRQKPEAFDQQPVEAAASISACLAAARAESGIEWPAAAMRAFNWFLGDNDLQTSLIDPDSGGCFDGLHPDRANENKGAESALSYLLAIVEIREFNRVSTMDWPRPTPKSVPSAVTRSISPRTNLGTHVASVAILEPPDLAPPTGSGTGRRPTVQAGD
jgi:glycosyltransferase involved in cell wall biosynthesis